MALSIYDFLTQSPKQISQALKAADIVKYKDIPKNDKDLCKLLGLTKDSRVDYYSTITRGGGTEWYIYFNLDYGFGPKRFQVELYVKGKCSVTYAQVGGHHAWADVYEKVCPLWDKRPQYHNLEFRIEGREYAPYQKGSWDDKEYPSFDDNKPLSEYIKIISDKAAAYKPFIETVEKACFNGDYEKAYNKYHFNPFKVGDMILSEDPGFSGCVRAMFEAKSRFDFDLTFDHMQGLYRYMYIHIEEYRKFNNDKTGNVPKPLSAIVHDLFWSNIQDNLTLEVLQQLIELGDAEGLVNKDEESWDSLYLKANKEFHFGLVKLQKELAKKHKIPEDYIGFFNYNEDTDTCGIVPAPKGFSLTK